MEYKIGISDRRETKLKELCHEIQPNYDITKCPLN